MSKAPNHLKLAADDRPAPAPVAPDGPSAPRSPERVALAAAIDRHGAATRDLAAIGTALEKLRQSIYALRDGAREASDAIEAANARFVADIVGFEAIRSVAVFETPASRMRSITSRMSEADAALEMT